MDLGTHKPRLFVATPVGKVVKKEGDETTLVDAINMNRVNIVVVVAYCTALATLWAFMRPALEPQKRLSLIQV